MTQLNELKTELASLRVQKIAGGSASKLTKMCVVLFRVVVGVVGVSNLGMGRKKGRAGWTGLIVKGTPGARMSTHFWRVIEL